MAKPPSRDIIKIIFINFFKSLRPRQIRGDLKGTDYMGTKYYEIAANPSIGKRKPQRWFVPLDKDNFEQEIPAEWMGWLRGRRAEAPTEEEVLKSLEIIRMKKENAAKLEAKFAVKAELDVVPKLEKGMRSFPQYGDEYEIMPGTSGDDKRKT